MNKNIIIYGVAIIFCGCMIYLTHKILDHIKSFKMNGLRYLKESRDSRDFDILTLPKYTKYYNLNRENTLKLINELKSHIKPVFDHYNVDVNIIYPSLNGKSYSLKKRLIFINTFKRNGHLYSIDKLIEISLHELTHVVCKTCDDFERFEVSGEYDRSPHTFRFYDLYKEIINKSIKLNVVNPSSCMFSNNVESSRCLLDE